MTTNLRVGKAQTPRSFFSFYLRKESVIVCLFMTITLRIRD